ncbi:unnamed protein product [Ixodes persulcatus]
MLCEPIAVERRRGAHDAGSRRSSAATYNVRLENRKHVSVCRDMFCEVLVVSHSAVTRLLKHKHERCELPPHPRGGGRSEAEPVRPLECRRSRIYQRALSEGTALHRAENEETVPPNRAEEHSKPLVDVQLGSPD